MKAIRVFSALGIILAATFGSLAQDPLTNGLVAYYPFNGNANDESGLGKHGTVEGATLVADRFGFDNSSYHFNGINNRITTAGEAGLPSGTEDFTIAMWATMDQPIAGDFRMLFANAGFAQFQLNLGEAAANEKRLEFYTGGDPVEALFSTNLTWNNAQWYQIVIVRAANRVTLLRDGQEIASQLFTRGNDAPAGQRNLTFGRRIDGSHPWKGNLDDIRVYNRALSSNEVQQLYTAVPPVPPLTNDLVAYYPFSGNAQDASGNGNNGTVANATLAADRFGVTNSAFTFNGQSSQITINDNPALRSLTSNYTFNAWVRFASAPSIDACILIKSAGGGDQRKWTYWQHVGGFPLGVGLHLYRPSDGYYNWNFDQPIAANRWYMLTFSASGTNCMIAVDGVVVSVQPGNMTLPDTTGLPLSMGGAEPGGNQWFNGSLDDIRIYNRALLSNEVQQLFVAESSPPTPPISNDGVIYVANQGSSNVRTFALTNGTDLGLFASNGLPAAHGIALDAAGNVYVASMTDNFIRRFSPSGADLGIFAANGKNPAPADLIGWWPAEGNAADVTGNHSGIITTQFTGSVAFSPGKVGAAFDFTGTNFVEIQPFPLTNFTIECWVNQRTRVPVTPNSSWGCFLISDEVCGVQDDWHLGLLNGGQLLFHIGDGAGGVDYQFPSTNTIPLNTYVHVAVTRSTVTGKIELYINGVLDSTFTAPHNRVVGMANPDCDIYPNTIGIGNIRRHAALGVSNNFDGLIDEPAIYNRALSAAEIAAIYNASSEAISSPRSIVFDATGNLYIANAGNNTVRRYSAGGADLGNFISNGLANPTGMAFDDSGNLYVANYSLNQVKKFAPDGAPLGTAISTGLNQPVGIAVLPNDGGFYVANDFASSIIRYNANGTIVSNLTSGTLGRLFYLASDAEGNLYVTRVTGNAVRKFSPTGQDLGDIATSGMDIPAGIAIRQTVATNSPAVIIAQPSNQQRTVGESASFSVVAGGTQPIFYQWRFNETNLINGGRISGATNAQLVINNVQLSDAGAYSVVVSNSVNSVLSSNAMLTVTVTNVPANGLVAYYPFSGNANDASGNGNHGAVANAALGVDRFGASDAAYNFNGQNAQILVNDNPALGSLTSNYTFSAWVRFASAPSIDSSILFKSAGGGNQSKWAFWRHVQASPLGIGVIISRPLDGTYQWNFNPSFTSNRWYMVTFSASGTNCAIALDGVVVSVQPGNLTLPDTTGLAMSIGGAEPGGNQWFNGSLDDIRIYNRALSASEVQQLYAEESALFGAPNIVFQPANQGRTVGQSASFSVVAGGAPPLSYQWRFNGTNLVDGGRISGATSSQLAISNVQLSDAGSYSVVVSNSVNSVLSSNATLTVTHPPAVVSVVSTTNAAGGLVTVPVRLIANGNENALGFSLTMGVQSPVVLTFDSVVLGSNAVGASLLVNTNQLGSRRIGVAIALPAGTTFAAGTQEVVQVRFQSSVLVGPPNRIISLTFGDLPTVRQLVSTNASTLSANYANGAVTLVQSDIEGDSVPRPNGDRVAGITDWVQIGRFVALLDTPAVGGEFQRADCAPKEVLGDGLIKVTDWVQAGRYAAGLDPLRAVGGPTSPSVLLLRNNEVEGASSGRDLKTLGSTVYPGQTVSVPVVLQSQGDENALSFSVAFNPAVFSYAGLTPGSNGMTLTTNVNTSQIASGKLGIVMGLSANNTFASGPRELLKVNLEVLPTVVPGSYPIGLGDQPVLRGISNPGAGELAATYTAGTLSVALPALQIARSGPNITLSWPAAAWDFTLQTSSDGSLPGVGWTNVPGVLQTNGGDISITLPLGEHSGFYRLRKP